MTFSEAIDAKRFFSGYDSLFLKAMGCIPVVGCVVTAVVERNLKKMPLTIRERCLVRIELLNDYKKSSIIRESLCILIVVTLIAFGILHQTTPLVIMGVSMAASLGIAIYNGYNIYRNQEGLSALSFSPKNSVVPLHGFY